MPATKPSTKPVNEQNNAELVLVTTGKSVPARRKVAEHRINNQAISAKNTLRLNAYLALTAPKAPPAKKAPAKHEPKMVKTIDLDPEFTASVQALVATTPPSDDLETIVANLLATIKALSEPAEAAAAVRSERIKATNLPSRKGTGVGGPEHTARRANASLLSRGAYIAFSNGQDDPNGEPIQKVTYRDACVLMGTLPAKEMAEATN